MPTRAFFEVDGVQVQGEFKDGLQACLAHIAKAIELGGRVVALHQEEVATPDAPSMGHKKGLDCPCNPIAFHASAPRMIVLANEARR